MKKVLFLIWLIIIVSATQTQADLIQNGSFETNYYTDVWSVLRQVDSPSTDITGWTVGRNNIDYIDNYFQPAEGTKSIDLNGSMAGSIYQTLGTETGTVYRVTFSMAGNFGDGTSTKSLRVTAGDFIQDYSFSKPVDWAYGRMGWTDYWFEFEAHGTVLLTFETLEPENSIYGPALDNVRVNAVPVPATIWLLGSGLIGLITVRNKFKN